MRHHAGNTSLVAQLLYASPAWSGFIKADVKAKLQSVLNKAVRYGFLTNYKPVEYLFESSDTTLFSAISRRPAMYCVRYLIHLKRHGIICISAALSAVQSSFLRKNLNIYRMLYTYIY